MKLTEKQAYMLIGAGPAFTIGAAAGVSLGYYLIKKRLELKYLTISNKEIAAAKSFYSALYKKDDFKTPEAAVEALGLEEVVVVEAVEALKVYQGVGVDPIKVMESLPDFVAVTKEEIVKNPSEVIVHNVFTEAQVESGFDYEEELKNRDESQPYIISHDEFMEAEPGYNQVTLTYYEGDDVLTDEKESPIDDVEETVGEDNLLRFGHGSQDSRIVYIRNERLDLDFEVVQSQGKYVEEVLGFIEHSDHRSKIRRFRGDDE